MAAIKFFLGRDTEKDEESESEDEVNTRHHIYLSMQYTEIFKVVKNENFQ